MITKILLAGFSELDGLLAVPKNTSLEARLLRGRREPRALLALLGSCERGFHAKGLNREGGMPGRGEESGQRIDEYRSLGTERSQHLILSGKDEDGALGPRLVASGLAAWRRNLTALSVSTATYKRA